jgi:hypothetical protein
MYIRELGEGTSVLPVKWYQNSAPGLRQLSPLFSDWTWVGILPGTSFPDFTNLEGHCPTKASASSSV